MGAFRKWVSKKPKILNQYKKFNRAAKSIASLTSTVTKNKKLKKAIDTLFTKKNFKIAGITTVTAIGVHHIMGYVKANSGCFLKGSNSKVCKVKELSCCQKDKVDNVPFCDNMQGINDNICDGFEEDKTDSCCRLCDCSTLKCDWGQTAECKKPDIAEALSYFAQSFFSKIWSGVTDIFPVLKYVVYILSGLFIYWISMFVYKRFRKQDD